MRSFGFLSVTATAAFLVGSFLAAPGTAHAQSILLTGATVYSTDGAGNATGNYWDTSPSGGYNLWVSLGATPLNGPTNAQASISQILAPGTYNFTLFGNPGGNLDSHGLNLFFEGSSIPAISVFAPTATNGASPTFVANSSTNTRDLNAGIVSGAGRTSFTSGNTTVALTAYRWEASTVQNQDLVSPYDRTPGGGADNQGSFTLTVTSTATAAPEPGSIALALTAGVPVIGIIRRRKKR